MMNSIFQELLHKGVLANYMDDFMIPAEMKKQLEERTIQFLKIAEKHNLCFKSVIRQECRQTLGRVRVRTVVNY